MSCCNRHTVLLISWLCNYIRMLFVLSDVARLCLGCVCLCEMSSSDSEPWLHACTIYPSETALTTLWPLHMTHTFFQILYWLIKMGKAKMVKAGKMHPYVCFAESLCGMFARCKVHWHWTYLEVIWQRVGPVQRRRRKEREVSSSHIRHEALGPGDGEVQMSLDHSDG